VSGFFAILRRDGKPLADQLLQKISAELATRGPDGSNLTQEDWDQGAEERSSWLWDAARRPFRLFRKYGSH
jgi:hypothetical protein